MISIYIAEYAPMSFQLFMGSANHGQFYEAFIRKTFSK